MAFGSSKSKSCSKPSSMASEAQQQQLASELIATELLMMQLLGGGSMEKNTKRLMEEHQRNAFVPSSDVRRSRPAPQPLTLGKPLRDGNGNTWWGQNDTSSATEYKNPHARLETPQTAPMRLSFDANANNNARQVRRGSATSPISASPLSTTHFIPASAMPGDYHHSHPYPSYNTHPEGQRRHRSGSSSLTPSPSSSTFNEDVDSYMAYAPAEPHSSSKKGKSLRGRARALFGGH